MELNKNNIEIYAAKHYMNSTCISKEEFYEDLQRYKLAQKMARKIAKGSSVNIRLMCNHVLCFTNNFELPAAKKILLFDITEDEQAVIKTVLNYLGFLVPGDLPNIKFNLNAAKALKEMDR